MRTSVKKLIGLLGDKFAQMPQRTAEMKQGLLDAPSQLANLLSPELAQRVRQARETPAGMTPQMADEWINKGMELTGLAPIGGLMGTFIGKTAKTWDAGKAKLAEELLEKGVDPREVWKQTGTLKGVDRELRQEIPDNMATLNDAGTWVGRADQGYSHPALYNAYPELAETQLRIFPGMSGGSFSPDGVTVGTKRGLEAGRSAAAHEFQHPIQQIEGWASGGNPEMMRGLMGGGELADLYSPRELNNAYRALAGETEARLTQARINMTMPERLQSYPLDMMDVPTAQQIIRRTPKKVTK